LTLLAASGSGAEAHAFAQRYDLPLPLWHYIAGAGASVALSVIAAALFARLNLRPAPSLRLRVSRGLALWLEAALRLLGVACLALLLAAGFLGDQGDWDSNLLPVGVWVLWWVGLAFLAALVADLWPVLDPWRSIGLWVFGRGPPRDGRGLATFGVWPAVLLFVVFAWAELVWTENAVPHKLALLIVAGSLFTWAGMALMGVDAWRRHCDAFGLFFGLFGRFAPLTGQRNPHGVMLVLRPYGTGLKQDEPPSTSVMAFVILLLGSVAFDGINETPFWESLTGLILGSLYDIGFVTAFGYGAAGALTKTFGMVATPLVFALIYLCVSALTGRLCGQSALLTARCHVLSLTPIAIGYHLAHYLSYLLIQGQAALPLLSDPLNLGWDLFGWRGREIDIGVVDARFIWFSAVGAIIAGHVAAVFLCHRDGLRDSSGWAAVQRQWPMSVLMILYTMLSLWTLSQPIVEVR
jgi:hypothetical protein